ncbi:MAG: L,D-transpeptidase [Cyanobacteria bacterium P01_F01_bin.13]
MTNAIRSLLIGLTVPLLGGTLALPSAAQKTAALPQPSLERGLIPTKLPAAELRKWPPPAEQPVELVLQLNERQLYVYRGDTLETTFPVAIGKDGWETPTGIFEVSYMLENPGWTNPFTGATLPPGPENPLGERWIAFWTDGQNEIGFHGTPNRGSIGQAASHGCVRLYNEHVRELYELVTPGTLVTVLP